MRGFFFFIIFFFLFLVVVVVSLPFELQRGGEETILFLQDEEEFEGFEEGNEEGEGILLGFQVAEIFDIVPGWW